MKHYGRYGFNEFFVALGYKGEVIKRFFLDYHTLSGDITVNLATGETQVISPARGGLDGPPGRHRRGDAHRRPRETPAEAPWPRRRSCSPTATASATSTLDDLLAFHRRQGRLATVTAVRPPARFGGIDFDGDRVAGFIEKPRSTRAGSTADSSSSSPGCSTTSTATTRSSRSMLLERLAEEGQLAAYRHEGFWQCMDTLQGQALSRGSVAQGLAALEDVVTMTPLGDPGFWRDRPTLVTGATGLLGGWVVRLSWSCAPMSSAWYATGFRRANLSVVGLLERVKVVRGDVAISRLSNASRRIRDRHGPASCGPDDRRRSANRNPVSTFETNVGRHLGAARGVPALPDGQGDRGRVIRQGLRRPDQAALHRRHAAAGASRLRREQVLRRPRRPDVRRTSTGCRSRSPVAATSTAAATSTGTASSPARSAPSCAAERPIIRSDGTFVRDYIYAEDAVRRVPLSR